LYDDTFGSIAGGGGVIEEMVGGIVCGVDAVLTIKSIRSETASEHVVV